MWRGGALLGLLLALSVPAAAQQGPQALEPTPVLTISPDQIFAGTRYGQAVQARLDEASRALVEENRRSEADLAAEELALTNRRATAPPKEFRVLAEAFDRKANGIRETQTAKARAITEKSDVERQRFFQSVLPVLGQIMREHGAVAIIDQSTVFLSFDRIDITATAIKRIDALLGDGSDTPGTDGAATTPPPEPTTPEPKTPEPTTPDAAPPATAGRDAPPAQPSSRDPAAPPAP